MSEIVYPRKYLLSRHGGQAFRFDPVTYGTGKDNYLTLSDLVNLLSARDKTPMTLSALVNDYQTRYQDITPPVELLTNAELILAWYHGLKLYEGNGGPVINSNAVLQQINSLYPLEGFSDITQVNKQYEAWLRDIRYMIDAEKPLDQSVLNGINFAPNEFDDQISLIHKKLLQITPLIPIKYQLMYIPEGKNIDVIEDLSSVPVRSMFTVIKEDFDNLGNQSGATAESHIEGMRKLFRKHGASISGVKASNLEIVLMIIHNYQDFQHPSHLDKYWGYIFKEAMLPKSEKKRSTTISKYQFMDDFRKIYWTKFIPSYNQSLMKNVTLLRNWSKIQKKFLDITPSSHSPFYYNKISLSYDINLSESDGSDPLPDFFNYFHTDYEIPYISFINRSTGKGMQSRIYKGLHQFTEQDLKPEKPFEGHNPAIVGKIWHSSRYMASDKYPEELSKSSNYGDFSMEYLRDSKVIRVSMRIGISEDSRDHYETVSDIPEVQKMIKRLHDHWYWTQDQKVSIPDSSRLRDSNVSGEFYLYNTPVDEYILTAIVQDSFFKHYLLIDEKNNAVPYRPHQTKSTNNKKDSKDYINAIKFLLIGASSGGSSGIMGSKAIGSNLDEYKRYPLKAKTEKSRLTKGSLVKYMTAQSAQGTAKAASFITQDEMMMTKVMVNGSINSKTVQYFMSIIARLYQYYHTASSPYIQFYDMVAGPNFTTQVRTNMYWYNYPANNKFQYEVPRIFDDYGTVISDRGQNQSQGQDKDKNIKLLKILYPNIIVSAYARGGAQAPSQPIPLAAEDVPFWQMQRHLTGPKSKSASDPNKDDRKLVGSLKLNELDLNGNPRVMYYGCPDEYPYPGLKENKIRTLVKDPNNPNGPMIPHMQLWPYIPTCFKTQKDVKSDTKHKSANINDVTSSIIDGRLGKITMQVKNVLHMPGRELYRLGTVDSNNTFLDAILKALRLVDVNYVNQLYQNYGSLENIRSNLLNILGQGVELSILKQECYDMSTEDIATMLTDNQTYLDPKKTYRFFERALRVNIFLFEYRNSDQSMSLVLPRHKKFYVRRVQPGLNMTNNIHIIIHGGVNNITPPPCNLVIHVKEDLKMGKAAESERLKNIITGYRSSDLQEFSPYFSPEVYDRCFQAVSYMSKVHQISLQGELSRLYLTPFIDMISLYNIKGTPVSQYIDQYGKARYLKLNNGIYLGFPPTQPLNLPTFTSIKAGELPTLQQCLDLYTTGDPSFTLSGTTRVEQKISGIWMAYDHYQFGFYCPCQLTPLTEELAQLPTSYEIPNLVKDGANRDYDMFQRSNVLRKSAQLLDQLIKYLYLIEYPSMHHMVNYQVSPNPGAEDQQVYAFVEKYFYAPTQADASYDSLQHYNLSSLPRILPRGSVTEVLKVLRDTYGIQIIVGSGDQPRLYIWNPKLLQSVMNSLTAFAKTIANLDVKADSLREIQNYYEHSSDFSERARRDFLILNDREYQAWLQTQKTVLQAGTEEEDSLDLPLHFIIPKGLSMSTKPILLLHNTDPFLRPTEIRSSSQFYIIQNIPGGNFYRAFNAALQWEQTGINRGHEVEPYVSQFPDSLPPYKIYRLLEDGKIVVAEDHSGSSGGGRFINVLLMEGNYYMAMLPLV